MIKKLFAPLLLISLLSCSEGEQVDQIFFNGNIYTQDIDYGVVEAVAVKDGKIYDLGETQEIKRLTTSETQLVDLDGQFMMPGFIEGHGHYSGLGYSLIYLNLLHTKNWDEIIGLVEKAVEKAEPGDWITGRGWHQEKWDTPLAQNAEGYPYHHELSAISKDNPVMLIHASGHALFANENAMKQAGINAEFKSPEGGHIVTGTTDEPVGVFEENAMDPVRASYREWNEKRSDEEIRSEWERAIDIAEQECFENGITSFQDAGTSFKELKWFRERAARGDLNVRLWMMIRERFSKVDDRLDDYPIINSNENTLTVRAFKSELDGALGARGAWLLEPYADKAGHLGQNTTHPKQVLEFAELADKKEMQLCVHAIGDRANREVLNIFERFVQDKDLRWRIEHAQHLHPDDIPRFNQLGVIASMQGIHCTSDAPFVVKRLGQKRAKEGAYAWRSLLDAGAVIANGTDAPVEDVSVLESLYATVSRKRKDNSKAFFPEQVMTRKEALYSYTMGPAYAAFEDKLKGTITPGKLADFVVLDKDLVNCIDEDVLKANVVLTIVGGEIKYNKK